MMLDDTGRRGGHDSCFRDGEQSAEQHQILPAVGEMTSQLSA